MEEGIDSGPILIRRRFSSPKDPGEIDYIYDSIFRATVLVETIQKFSIDGKWHFEVPNNFGGETYFIIHPVLKHIAILSNI